MGITIEIRIGERRPRKTREQAFNEIVSSKAHLKKLCWLQERDITVATELDHDEGKCIATLNETYQILAMNFIFQGGVFAALAQMTKLKCHQWWTAFSFSLFVSLTTLALVLHKLHRATVLRCTIEWRKDLANYYFDLMDDLKHDGGDFNVNQGFTFPNKPRLQWKDYNYAHFVVVGLSLATFSTLIMASCKHILCMKCMYV